MSIAKSKLTAQGQISVPADVRKKLGVGPRSVLERDEQGDQVIVRRAGRYTSEEIHRALFPGRITSADGNDLKGFRCNGGRAERPKSAHPARGILGERSLPSYLQRTGTTRPAESE